MMRKRSGAVWLLAAACATAVSCADVPTAPAASDADELTSVAAHAASSDANARGIVAGGSAGSIASGPPAHANGSGNTLTTETCGPLSRDTGDTLLLEALPGDVCAIARYLPGAPQPGRQMVSEFIDENGGSLRLGDFEIVVPAGAVSSRTRFAIMLPPPGHGDRAYAEFLPHNQEFALPVTIRLPHAITDAAADAPITWWSQNGKTWIDQASTITTDGRVEAQVGHFSFYGTRARSGITIAGG